MSAPPATVQNVSHRLRVAAHQAAAFVATLSECTDAERAELRGFVSFVAEAADALNPERQMSAGVREAVVVPMLSGWMVR